MRRFIFLFFLAVLFFSSKLSASDNNTFLNIVQNASFKGTIVDKESKESLSGVTVQILNTGNKAYTDFDGNFTFRNIKPGSYKVSASLISYREVVAEIIINIENDNNVKLELE